MRTLISTDLNEWAAHRRAVVFAVSRQVPDADSELATSRGLEQLCREIVVHGAVDRPVDFWHHAAVDAATASLAGSGRTPPADVAHEKPARRPVPAADATGHLEMPPSIRPAEPADSPGCDGTTRSTGPHAVVPGGAECRTTRNAMHDYIRHRLLPNRRKELEDHLVDCAECTRAFADIRESFWMLRTAAPVLVLGTLTAPGVSPAPAPDPAG